MSDLIFTGKPPSVTEYSRGLATGPLVIPAEPKEQVGERVFAGKPPELLTPPAVVGDTVVVVPPGYLPSGGQVEGAILRHPEPDTARDVTEKAYILSQSLSLPIEQAMDMARAMMETKEPEPRRFLEDWADNWKAGVLQFRLGELGYKMATGARSPQIEEQVKTLNQSMPSLDNVQRGPIGTTLLAVANTLPLMLLSSIEGLKYAGVAAAGAATATALAGAPLTATGIGAPVTGIASMATAASAAAVAYKVATGTKMTQTMIGLSYLRTKELKGPDGQQIPDAVAIPIALVSGTIQGLLENAQFGVILRSIPGAEQVLGKAAGRVLTDVFKAGAGGTIARGIARILVSAGTEGFEEGLQTLTQNLGDNLAAAIATESEGVAFPIKPLKAILSETIQDTIMGAAVGGVLTTPGHLVTMGKSLVAERQQIIGEQAAKPVEPTPIEPVRQIAQNAVEGQGDIAVARTEVDAAAKAKAQEIVSSAQISREVLDDLVELSEMQDALKAHQEVVETEGIKVQQPIISQPGMPTPSWIQQNVQQDWQTAQRMGIVEKIEELAAQRKTAADIQRTLGLSRPDRSIIYSVRSVLGIPSMDDKVEFEAWLTRRAAQGPQVAPTTQAIAQPLPIAAEKVEPQRPFAESPMLRTMRGEFVPDIELGAVQAEPWAQEEIATRELLREKASELVSSSEAKTADDFITQAKTTALVDRPDAYYQAIWDTAPKQELAEDATVDEQIDRAIEAEKPKVTKVDKMIADIEKIGWQPDAETVQGIVDQWKAIRTSREPLTFTPEMSVAFQKAQLVQYLTDRFLRKPTAGIGQDAIDTLTELQSNYAVKDVKALETAKEAIRQWQELHPDEEIPAEAQEILDRRSIYSLSVTELLDLYRQAQQIREDGYAQRNAEREAIREKRRQQFATLIQDIPGGIAVKRAAEYATMTTKKAEAKLEKKGRISAALEHPLRLLESMGPGFKDILWTKRKKLEGQWVKLVNKLDNQLKELYTRTKIKPIDLVKPVPGTDYLMGDLLFYYGQMQDPDGRRAVLWGNDEDETKLSRAFQQIPQNYKDWIDGVMDIMAETYPQTKSIQARLNGVIGPQVRRYLPLRRQTDVNGISRRFDEDLSTESAIRSAAHAVSLSKGWINKRVHYKDNVLEPRIRTDILNIIAKQVFAETKYIAMEEMTRDWNWLLGGKTAESKKLLEAVKQKYGTERVKWLQDYAKAVINPDLFRGVDFFSLPYKALRNTNAALIMLKLGTALIQVEGPFRYLAELRAWQTPYLAVGLAKATFAPKSTLQTMYNKSPVMRAMADYKAIDPALQEMRGTRPARSAIGFALQEAKETLNKAGFFMLTTMNKWTIASGWTAMYEAELKRTNDEQKAVQAADDATFRTQPSGELADAPRIYWTAQGSFWKSFLLRFTRSENQLAQMLFVDAPKALAKGQIDKVAGVMAAIAVGTMINGLRRRRRFPETPEEMMEDAAIGLGDVIGAGFYQVGEAVAEGAVAAITGKPRRFQVGELRPMEAIYMGIDALNDAIRGEITMSQLFQVARVVLPFFRVPVQGLENIARTMYDWEWEEWGPHWLELLGRAPKE